MREALHINTKWLEETKRAAGPFPSANRKRKSKLDLLRSSLALGWNAGWPAHRSGVSGLFEDLPGRLNVLAVFAALQQTHLLLHAHAQALHHLGRRETQRVDDSHGHRNVHGRGHALTCSAVLVTRPWCSRMACFWENRCVWLFLSRARWICGAHRGTQSADDRCLQRTGNRSICMVMRRFDARKQTAPL